MSANTQPQAGTETAASKQIMSALAKDFIYTIEGSSDHPVRCAHKSVDDAIAHIKAQDGDIAHHRALLEAKDGALSAQAAAISELVEGLREVAEGRVHTLANARALVAKHGGAA